MWCIILFKGGDVTLPHLAQDVSTSHGAGQQPMHADVHLDKAPDATSSGASHAQPTLSSNVSVPDQQLSSSGSDQLILPHRTRLQGGIRKPKEFTH
jgi:hypothetical protein